MISTDQSFTVAGWVETPGLPSRDVAVFSQEGNINSGFTLRYVPDQDIRSSRRIPDRHARH